MMTMNASYNRIQLVGTDLKSITTIKGYCFIDFFMHTLISLYSTPSLSSFGFLHRARTR